jgi:CubicO group peptidase (beta-lactamase class C family)
MRRVRISVAVALALLAIVPGVRSTSYAQTLTTGLFDRYLDALRQELGIPGLSGAIVQDGNVVWSRGFGRADVSGAIAATASTPYPILNLSETIGATILLRDCVDRGIVQIEDRVIRWVDQFPDSSQTFGQALGHLSTTNSYRYDSDRFAMLSAAAAQCAKRPYAQLVADEVLERFQMNDSVPGADAVADNAALFTSDQLQQYRQTLAQMALPYRISSSKTPTRADYTAAPLSASTGLISSALDLARFDAALDDEALVSRETLSAAWSAGTGHPTGLGWFVQNVNGKTLVWHFGVARGAYSGLILKVPGDRLTFILLANSDGVASGLNTDQPNALQSHFVTLFLQFFAP